MDHVAEAVLSEISKEEEFRDTNCEDEAMQDADSEDESNRNVTELQ